MSVVKTKKSDLRAHFAHMRSAISPGDAVNAAVKAAEQFMRYIPIKQQEVVSGYYPIYSELSTEPVMHALDEYGCVTALPVIVDDTSPLVFKEWHVGHDLAVGNMFGLKEPVSSTQSLIPHTMIVPLLAFDAKGHRLGYGRGFFDRTISYFRSQGHEIIEVGFAFDCQFSETDLPVGKHDQTLDFVVTESKVIKI